VEGEVGWFRRNHLSPVPVVNTLDELNARIDAADIEDLGRRIEDRARTVGQDFAVEAPLLASLPAEDFEPGLWLTPTVDRFARITVRCCRYSVPIALIGRRVRVCLRASELVVFDGHREVARHPRSVRKGSQTLVLDHYLEVLIRKPGALPGAIALEQARTAGVFTAAHDAFWAAARRVHGQAGGTRELVEVLLLHRHLPHADVVAGLAAALSVGAATADVVAVEARKAAQTRTAPIQATTMPSGVAAASLPGPAPGPATGRVLSLTARRLADPATVIAGLPTDPRPLPSVAHYDDLLRPPTRPSPAADRGATT